MQTVTKMLAFEMKSWSTTITAYCLSNGSFCEHKDTQIIHNSSISNLNSKQTFKETSQHYECILKLTKLRGLSSRAKLLPTFADRGCHVAVFCFLDRSRYFFLLAHQLYSRGWVNPVPDPLLRKSGSVGNRTRTSWSVARNSDHETTEAIYFLLHNIYKLSSYLTGNTIHLRSIASNLNQ
jgi:hypothetical protein